MNNLLFFTSVLVSVFSVLNPFSAMPTLVALTTGYTKAERNRVVNRSIAVASGVVVGFMFLGVYIFEVLGINIADFEVAGGILLFKVAFDMLQGRTSSTKLTPDEEQESMSKEAIGIVPIGMPLLAGPGTITTTIIYFNMKSAGIVDKGLVIIALAIVMSASLIILRYSPRLFDRMGKTGSLIITRIMGLLLAAIGIEFIATGIGTLAVSLGL